MDSECKVEHRPAQWTLSVRFRAATADLPLELGRAYLSVGRYLGEIGAPPSGPAFASYHELGRDGMEVEAGFAVDKAYPGNGEVHPGLLPEGEVATIVHTGPYQGITSAYEALTSWVRGRGLEPAGPPCELYLNDPSVTPAGELKTKLTLPVS